MVGASMSTNRCSIRIGPTGFDSSCTGARSLRSTHIRAHRTTRTQALRRGLSTKQGPHFTQIYTSARSLWYIDFAVNLAPTQAPLTRTYRKSIVLPSPAHDDSLPTLSHSEDVPPILRVEAGSTAALIGRGQHGTATTGRISAPRS
ncbi:hypothetical protein C8Q80DRAFT_953119 [Daedaleopsis nitida]|nr:hypothetical protein C8Q80DRAFT_953119 [Daedaleopsis nitida]